MKMSIPPNETIGGACEVVGSLHPHSIIGGIRDVVEEIDSPKDNGIADAYAISHSDCNYRCLLPHGGW
jgi:hypothetical protein